MRTIIHITEQEAVEAFRKQHNTENAVAIVIDRVEYAENPFYVNDKNPISDAWYRMHKNTYTISAPIIGEDGKIWN